MPVEKLFRPYRHQDLILSFDVLAKMDPVTMCPTANFCGHRRCGKSFGVALLFLLMSCRIENEKTIFKIRGAVESRNPRLVYMAKTKENARNIIWPDLKMIFKLFGERARFDNNRLRIVIPRPHLGDDIEILLMALRDHDKVRGMSFRMIALDEVQQITEEALRTSIYPTIHDNHGALITTGTATSVGHYQDMLKTAIANGTPSWIVPVTKTNIFTEAEQKTWRAQMGEFGWAQEYMCDFTVSTKTAFFRDTLSELERRSPAFHALVPDRRNVRMLAVDIGVGEGFAAWLLEIQSTTRLGALDYYSGYELLDNLRRDVEDEHGPIDVYAVPFDAATRRLEAREPRNALDVFREVFPRARPIVLQRPANRGKLLEIERTHRNLHMLSFPPLKAATGALNGLSLLKNYRRKESKDGRPTDALDKSDGSNHCGDALVHAYMALDVRDGVALSVPRYKSSESVVVNTMPSVRRGRSGNVGRAAVFMGGSDYGDGIFKGQRFSDAHGLAAQAAQKGFDGYRYSGQTSW